MSAYSVIDRARMYFEGTVYPWWQNIVCKWPLELRKFAPELLLAGVYLQLDRLTEALSQGGNYFRITPFQLLANDAAVQVLDIEVQGRVREVSIWMDSAVGSPDPTIRISTDGSGAVGNGVRMTPGGPNELGKVPPETRLYMSSDVTINGYIIERG